MKKLGQKGELNILIIPLILISILFIVAATMAFMIYQKEQNYKNNTDKIASAQAQAAQTKQSQIDQQHFAEKEKQPLRTYIGPAAWGALKIEYPKTWSVYVDTTQGSGMPVNGYAYPGVVPNTGGQGSPSATTYALRFQILGQNYNQIMQNFTSQLQQGKITINPYQPKNISGTVGVIINGAIEQNVNGSMVVLPLRATTVEIWTESQDFVGDFNNYILPNFSFNP